ncbi:MAG: hypothetical protein CL878_02705 [Dehalococcoidia bacterium]|nr:hypothetical protein [Dehalococcoidia bacterium]
MGLEHFVIHRSTDYLCAFPDIIRLQNGDLLTVFRESAIYPPDPQSEGKRNERISHYHVVSGSRVAAVRSTDDGRTWDPASRVVLDGGNDSQDLNMPLISQLVSGELIVVNHRWYVNMTEDQVAALRGKRYVHARFPGPIGTVGFDSLYFIRSSDQGYTWGDPQRVQSSHPYGPYIGKTALVELPDGTLLMPLYGPGPYDEKHRAFLDRSTDGGHTWGSPSTVAYDPERRIDFHEPPLLLLPNGKLLTMIRTAGADGYLYQAFSDDGGWTWQGLRRTPIWGHPAHLLRLPSGRILCAYGHRREPFGVRAVVSEDEGGTWQMDRELVIRSDGLHRDLGYPASVLLQDDRILTVYYFHDEDGIRYIAGSTYTEDDL